jgi:hypothetical protein
MNSVQDIINSFVAVLVVAVEENVLRKTVEAATAVFRSAKFPHGLATASRHVTLGAAVPARAKQLCPVPGCQGLAAPIFGMVCGDHRNVAKLKIARYRAERRAARRGGLAPLGGGQVTRVRRPRPKQFCPVPGCTGLAAPIFGMVCGEHRDVARSKIARYRKDRKARAARDELRAAELSV